MGVYQTLILSEEERGDGSELTYRSHGMSRWEVNDLQTTSLLDLIRRAVYRSNGRLITPTSSDTGYILFSPSPEPRGFTYLDYRYPSLLSLLPPRIPPRPAHPLLEQCISASPPPSRSHTTLADHFPQFCKPQ
jgi:hypothetical protein